MIHVNDVGQIIDLCIRADNHNEAFYLGIFFKLFIIYKI